MMQNNSSTSVQTAPVIYIQDPVDYFIKTKRDSIWKKNQAAWKKCFQLQLRTLKLFEDNQADTRLMHSFVYRLGLGYWGIGKQSGIASGISSYNAFSGAGVKVTHDHLIGAQLIGKTIHKAFAESGYDETYMMDEFLYEHLWMWMTIRVTQEEHRSQNISKTITDVEEKKKLRHYINVSPLVVPNK